MLRALLRTGGIKCEIERQHINARLADNPKGTVLSMVADEPAQVIFRHVAGLRNARDLEIGGFGRDVGVETAGRGGYQVGREPGLRGFPASGFRHIGVIRSIRALLVGPRLEPPELAAL